MLKIININVIPKSTNVSFQINSIPAPFSIIFLIIVMNHFGGIIWQSHCIITGMFSIGKINPERRIVGNISPTSESIIAICWLLVVDEINIPNDNAVKIYNIHSTRRRMMLPYKGILNTKNEIIIIITASQNDRKI